ncbi:MAG: MotA/TolQ/ExbB proton channel family protein [Caldimicrobium sp.]
MEFLKFFWQIGWVGRGVLFFLLLMSFTSWYYIFYNFFYFRRFKDLLERWRLKLENQRDISGIIREVKNSGDDLSKSLKRFVMRFAEIYDYYFGKKEKNEVQRDELQELAEKDLEEYVKIEQERGLLELGKGLGFLATTASTAPFIGLFGTVWGIMSAFHEIGLKGSASLATVAPGIAEALINTALGLLVAIPASLAYNYFLLKRESLAKEMELLYRSFFILGRREFFKS